MGTTHDILPGVNGEGAKLPHAVGRRPTAPGFPSARGRAGPDTDGGKISPRGCTPVRARYFGPSQGVACWAPRQGRGIRSHSARHVRRVGLAPAVRGRGARAVPSVCLAFLWFENNDSRHCGKSEISRLQSERVAFCRHCRTTSDKRPESAGFWQHHENRRFSNDHGGEAQVPQGLDWSGRHPLSYTSVDRPVPAEVRVL